MKINESYDYVIIGAGLSGLLLTRALQTLSSKVLLLEGADSVGGMNQLEQHGLRFLPDTELSRSAIQFMQNYLPQTLALESVDVAPVTFDSGSLRPFVGFGERAPAFYDEISYFLAQRELRVGKGPSQWVQLLAQGLESTKSLSVRSMVTKFVVENGLVTSVIVNGQKNVHAHNFIYCGPLRDLHVLFPDEVLSARQKHKLAKGKYWTAVGLDLLHKNKVSDSQQTHILNGTTDDEVGPCVGQFMAVSENGEQLSQWVSFLDNEDAEESENIANALKKIKRQLKRVHPEAQTPEMLKFERIQIAPFLEGHGELKITGHQSLTQLPNLFIGSGTMNSQKNLLGSLCQAQLVASSMGVGASSEVTEMRAPSEDSLSELQPQASI